MINGRLTAPHIIVQLLKIYAQTLFLVPSYANAALPISQIVNDTFFLITIVSDNLD